MSVYTTFNSVFLVKKELTITSYFLLIITFVGSIIFDK